MLPSMPMVAALSVAILAGGACEPPLERPLREDFTDAVDAGAPCDTLESVVEDFGDLSVDTILFAYGELRDRGCDIPVRRGSGERIPPPPPAVADPGEAPTGGLATAFGDGRWLAGETIAPGTYMTADASDVCLFQIDLDTSSRGLVDLLDESGRGAGQHVVTVANDEAVETLFCGVWTRTGPPPTASESSPTAVPG